MTRRGFFGEFWKGAALRTELQPHQQRVIDRLRAEDQPGLVVAHGLGSGKCARGDTVVWTSRGLLPLAALFPALDLTPGQDCTLDGDGLSVASWTGKTTIWTPVRARYAQRLPDIETTVRVGTHRGHVVEVTRAHPMLCVREGALTWVPAAHIQPGDALATASSLQGCTASTDLTDDLWHLLTWQTAEGWESSVKPDVAITQKDPAILYELQERFRRAVPGSTSGHVRGKDDRCSNLHISSKEYRAILEAAGHRWGDKSARRRMPDSWALLPSERLLPLVRAFFDAEGHVAPAHLEITLASRELCLQYQYALLRFGVRSALHGKEACATNGLRIMRPYWRISISGEDAHRLAALLGPESQKWAALEPHTRKTANPNYGVPATHLLALLERVGLRKAAQAPSMAKETAAEPTLRTLIARLRTMCAAPYREHCALQAAKLGGTAQKYAARTAAALEEHHEELLEAAERLERLMQAGLRFERVISITEGSAGGYVYDLEVDSDAYDCKNYVAGPGGLIFHNTLTSIGATEALGLPATVITPAALQANYQKELTKHLDAPPENLSLKSLQGVTRKGPDALEDASGLLVLDEAHRVRDPASKGYQTIAAAPAAKRMLLTASPTYNHPADLAALVNLAAGDKVLPADKREFENAFVQHQTINPSMWGRLVHGAKPGERVSLKRDPRLTSALDKWVDYHGNADSVDFPRRVDETVHVPLSSKQREVYEGLFGEAPAWVRYKVRSGLPPSKQELAELNTFLTGVRQAQLSPAPYGGPSELEHATKQQAAFQRFQEALKVNPEHRAVVYSNYLDAGLSPYRKLLEQAQVPYAAFTGDMKPADRIQAVKDYNEGKLKALLVSSAGGEGLDLKGTRQVQILEPHFNEEKLKQVIGRGIRYKSHEHLPEAQREVKVERYLSQLAPSMLDKIMRRRPGLSADEYLQQLSEDKERLNRQLTAVLEEQTKKRTRSPS